MVYIPERDWICSRIPIVPKAKWICFRERTYSNDIHSVLLRHRASGCCIKRSIHTALHSFLSFSKLSKKAIMFKPVRSQRSLRPVCHTWTAPAPRSGVLSARSSYPSSRRSRPHWNPPARSAVPMPAPAGSVPLP